MARESAGDEAIRRHVRGMWAAVAGSWEEHAAYADARGAGLAERMLEKARPRAGERVLELAYRPGGLGLAAARLVAPGGEVVLSGVVPEMTAIAAARAAASGCAGVSTRVLDLERIDEPDGSYDVVLCREGLMFAVDPAQAVREIGRVLRPGGRLAVAVWGPRERNPWLAIVFDAVGAELGRPVPPRGLPGPFSLSDAERLHGLLDDAGLAGVEVGDVPVPLRAGDVDAWWERTRALAGPLATMLDALSSEAAAAIRERAREAVRPYRTPDGLELPGLSLLASATAATRGRSR